MDDDYVALHDAMSLEIYNKSIKGNLIYSLLPFPYDGKIKSSFKKLVVTLLGRRKYFEKDLLTLHLLRNETYYYAARHALELISKEKHGG